MNQPPEVPGKSPASARAVTALVGAGLLGLLLAELSENALGGRSAIDVYGLTLVPLASAAVGLLIALIDPRAQAKRASWYAASYCLGVLVSAGIHDHLSLLPFAVAFTALVAGLPFFLGYLATSSIGKVRGARPLPG